MASLITTITIHTFRGPLSEPPSYLSPAVRALKQNLCGLTPPSNARTRAPFKPRSAAKGTSSYQLRQFAEATLGSGSLRKAVKLPEGEDLNEWLAVNVVDFYNQINLLYGAITEFCSPQSCPEMKATDEFEYLWQDSENFKRPTKMSAPEYIEHLMSWVQSNIDNEQMFPSRLGVPFPKAFSSLIRQIFKRLYRVYAHIYCHHYPVVVHLGLEPHLNTSFKHYVLFVDEHRLATEVGRRFNFVRESPAADQRPLHPSERRSHVLYPSTLPPFEVFDISATMNTARAARLGLRATQQFSVPRTAALNGLRTYATPAQNVKPPVALFGVDGTYATALYTASAKSSALDQTSKALSSLAQTFKADRKLTSIIAAPTLSASDKQQIIQELQKIAGNDKGDIIKNFLQTLAENNRLGLLEGICQKFETLMGAHRGEMEVTITSAQELDNKTINRLEKAVSKHELSQGKKLKIVTKVNPEIVGGLVVEIGDRTIDLSVSSKLAKLNKALTDAL
ncbi:hypothetical protein KXX57_000086 [Aspergillus fumigatus]|nr:hypothetical protein KXX57_000086 [Aspergillus fumigatus]KAH2924016.1 hypothetical protein KXW25_003299 [Aspergillus fumigatus]